MPESKKVKHLSKGRYMQTWVMSAVLFLVVIIGIIILGISKASAPNVSVHASSGSIASPATVINAGSATNGHYVKFTPPVTGGNPLCGFKTSGHASKVMIIWEENHDYSAVIGNSSAPYINGTVVKDCANATNYNANGHYSLPNYMTMTSSLNNGVSYFSSGPWTGDCAPTSSSCTTSTNSIFQQLGSNWKSFAEDMPSNCDRNPNDYPTKHNPAVYYNNINGTTCPTNDVGFSSSTKSSGALYNAVQSGLPALSTVSPNLQDDMHDGSVNQADTWLSGWIPVITAGSDYQTGKLAILIVSDEGSGSNSTSSSHTFAVGLSASTTPGSQPGTSFDENSILKTMEDITGQSAIGGAANATSLVSGFGF